MGRFGARISDIPLHAVRSSGARARVGSVALGSEVGNILGNIFSRALR
jgi:hypothetical protein